MSGFEDRNLGFLNLFDSLDGIVALVGVRLATVNQVASANTDAWQKAYDAEIAKATRDGGEITEKVRAQAIRVANVKVPPPTEEQIEAIESGESAGSGVAGVPAPETVTSSPFSTFLESVGGRFVTNIDSFDPETDLLEGETYMVDPTNVPGEVPRIVIVPSDILASDQAAVEQYFIREWEATQEKEEGPPPKNIPLSQRNPYIGVGEGHRTEIYQPRVIDGTPIQIGYEQAPGVEYELPGQLRSGGQQTYAAEFRTEAPVYRESDIRDFISTMSVTDIMRYQGKVVEAGLYPYDEKPVDGYMSSKDIAVIAEVMNAANLSNRMETRNFWGMLDEYAKTGAAYTEKNTTKAPALIREPFSVPAHLRSVPGEKTVAQEVKARFSQQLGRNATDEELVALGNELSGYYQKSNQEEIALYLAAYNGDNQGLLTGAQMQRIEEPGAASSFDIGEKWANEIDLNARRETNSESFSRMLSATMGNRPSVGNLTAAGGVAQVGRY